MTAVEICNAGSVVLYECGTVEMSGQIVERKMTNGKTRTYKLGKVRSCWQIGFCGFTCADFIFAGAAVYLGGRL